MTAKSKKNPKGAGRKKLTLNWENMEGLCQIQCTLPEVALFFKMSEDAIQSILKREKGMTFTEYSGQFTNQLKISLRREMIDMAITQKDKGMIIYLSKQYLGFSDKVEMNTTVHKPKRMRFYVDKTQKEEGKPKKIQN